MTSTPEAARQEKSRAQNVVLWPTAAWFWALQFAILNPIMATLLVTLYGATVAQAGLALGAYNVAGFIASFVIPTIADRRSNYLRPLLLAGFCGLAMVTLLAVTGSLLLAVLALVLLGGPPGVGSTLLFAQLRHEGATPERVVRTRALVSFAWVVGPPLATALIGLWGNRAALALLAIVAAVNVITAILLVRQHTKEPPVEATPRPTLAQQLRGGHRWAIVIAFIGLQATNVATVTTSALFVVHQLHAPVVWAGITLGVAALLEIPALLLISKATANARRLLLLGCACGVAYYGLAGLTHDTWQLLALQPLNAWFFATVAGLGLTVFQDVFPSPGLASGLFTNTRRVAAIISGLLIATVAAAPDTYRAVYVVSAVIVLTALIGLAAAGRRKTR